MTTPRAWATRPETTDDITAIHHVHLAAFETAEEANLVAALPAHQRTGAGSAVIRTALQAARAQGESFVIVLDHPEYYPRFGFQRAAPLGI